MGQSSNDSFPTAMYIAGVTEMTERLLPALSRALQPTYSVEIADCASQIGSGALPVETLPSAALRITPASGDDADVRRLAQVLRSLPLPVIGRLHKTSLWLDLRCLDQEQAFLGQLDGLRL